MKRLNIFDIVDNDNKRKPLDKIETSSHKSQPNQQQYTRVNTILRLRY